MKSLIKKFILVSIFFSSVLQHSTFAQSTKIQKKLEATSTKACDANTLDQLKGEITDYLATIFCARAGDVSDFGFCATKLISGAAFTAIGHVHQIDGKSQLQRYAGRSEEIAKLKATNNLLFEELAKSRNTRDVLIRGISGTDKALEEVIKLHKSNPDDVREQFMNKKTIHENNITDLRESIDSNSGKIAKLKNMSLEEILSDIRTAKTMRVAGGAAALVPMKLNWLTFLDIGPDCNLRGVVSELSEDCRPLPVFGDREMELLYGNRLKELAKSSPLICSHIENIKDIMALRVEALNKMYNEGISYSQPKCEAEKISYSVNGNGYVKSGEVTLELGKDKSIKKTVVETGKLKYTFDYEPNRDQMVNSLSWESSDPNFPGVRQVSRKEIPSAMKQEIVERGISFHVLNRTAGNAAIACCAERGKNCEGFLPAAAATEKTKGPASR